MATIESLHTHLVDELVDLLDAESQLTQALPKLAKNASSKRLGAALQKHLKETRGHIRRLNQALRALGENPRRKPCEGMEGLLKEGDTMMNNTPAGALRDGRASARRNGRTSSLSPTPINAPISICRWIFSQSRN